MPRLDDLPPDLRATLSLLVDRGKTYDQVATLLGIPESAVRDRAHAALDALAGAPGQSAAPSTAAGQAAPVSAAPAGAGPPPGAATGLSGAAAGLPVSRRGGALLLSGIVVAVIVVVVLLTTGGGSGTSSGTNSGTGTATGASAKTSTDGHTTSSGSSTKTTKSSSSKTASVTNQLTLASPDPSSKTVGIVEILAEGSQHAFYMATEHLPPSQGFSYVVWLYNSPSSAQAISKAPPVTANGRMQGGALLPANAGSYSRILLTRETSNSPTHPGPIVLSGPFSLHK
jgi:Sigma-70, region 4